MSFTATEGKPKYFPVAFRPIEPGGELGMAGMRVRVERPGLPTGVVGASYEDRILGPRCFVKFPQCSGWFSVYDIEPLEPVGLDTVIDVFG